MIALFWPVNSCPGVGIDYSANAVLLKLCWRTRLLLFPLCCRPIYYIKLLKFLILLSVLITDQKHPSLNHPLSGTVLMHTGNGISSGWYIVLGFPTISSLHSERILCQHHCYVTSMPLWRQSASSCPNVWFGFVTCLGQWNMSTACQVSCVSTSSLVLPLCCKTHGTQIEVVLIAQSIP